MGVKIRVNRGKLFLDIYEHGRRHWEGLGLTITKDKASNDEAWRLAELARNKREQQLMAEGWGFIDRLEAKRSLVSYAEEVAKRYGAKHPMTYSLGHLREFFGERQLGEVSERTVEDYRAFLLHDGKLSKATASSYFAMLKMLLKRAVRDRILPHSPAQSIKTITIPESNKATLTGEELAKLAAVHLEGELGGEVRRAFLFACSTGLRVSDIRSLTWADIKREAREIRKRQVKTNRVVMIPLNATAWELIDDGAIHNRQEPVFPHLAAAKNTNDRLIQWGKRAGLDVAMGWHIARRTFATFALENGTDISVVSKLLGHSKIAQTLTYAKVGDKLKRRAVDGLPAIEIKERMG